MRKTNYITSNFELCQKSVSALEVLYKENGIDNITKTRVGSRVTQTQTYYDTKTKTFFNNGGYLRLTRSQNKDDNGRIRYFVDYKKNRDAEVKRFETGASTFSLEAVCLELKIKERVKAVLEAECQNERYHFRNMDLRLAFMNMGAYVDFVVQRVTINPYSRDCNKRVLFLTLSDKTAERYSPAYAESIVSPIDKCFSLCDELLVGYGAKKVSNNRYQELYKLVNDTQLSIDDENES